MLLHPMDFEEFLWAMGDETLMPLIASNYERRQPLGQLMHRRAMDLLRQYIIVGGMPQAVQKYVDTRDFAQVDYAKRQILKQYLNDIHKFAADYQAKVTNVFDTITSLHKCIAKYGQYIATPYVLHSGGLSERNGIVYLPLYMTPLLY